jgi:hypothetical protein
MLKSLIVFLIALTVATQASLVHHFLPVKALAVAPLSAQTFSLNNDQSFSLLPKITLYYDPSTRSGVEWAKVKQPKWNNIEDNTVIGRAAFYLKEALDKMTGRSFEIVSDSNTSKGIILVLLSDAPIEIRHDPEIQNALTNIDDKQYSSNEAFFIKTEKDRVLLVANSADGLLSAAVDLMESVGYEILGLGPRWTYVPDFHNKKLFLKHNRIDRPSYYIRGLTATSGQHRGVGTITSNLTSAEDETVFDSYWRWVIGARIHGKSMPAFPGHILYKYHKAVLDYMRKNRVTHGFLAKTQMGLFKDRPEPSIENKQLLWINTDTSSYNANQVFSSTGSTWKQETDRRLSVNLDLSVPYVRQIIFNDMKEFASRQFQKYPNKPAIFGIDSEDGVGSSNLGSLSYQKNWYPQYLTDKGIKFGEVYALHDFLGLNQPLETWDSNSESDTIYGTANWLLREFDNWIDSLPESQRKTSSGKSKKDLIRCSFYSYNYHDVPPNFNPDLRTRVMIAGYPKNRGTGKWANIKTEMDTALALKIMLPNEPLANYRIISLAKSWDLGYSSVAPRGRERFRRVVDKYRTNTSASVENIIDNYQSAHKAGFRAMAFETDFNFGKQGLEYYLTSKILWNADYNSKQLSTIRDRWFQKSFGSAWQEMKSYYDFMLAENYPQCNNSIAWLKAVKIIDKASQKLEQSGEISALKRIDDVKQYWYNLYLFDTKQTNSASLEFKTFLWKGQMSYMVAMHALLDKYFNSSDVASVVGREISRTPAHYTHEETQVWWNQVLTHWERNSSSQCL